VALSTCSHEIDLQRRTPVEQEDFEPLVPRETFDRRILRERDQGFESLSPPPTSHQDVGSPGDTISRPVGDFPGIGSLRAPRRFSLPAEFVTPRAFPPLRRALPNKIRRRRNRDPNSWSLSRVPLSQRAERR